MKMDEVAGSKYDEYYTPPYAINPLLNYIQRFDTIWCPFDTHQSHFVRLLSEDGFNVVYSHIDDGQDFMTMPVPECDAIISNPPYSIKTEILQRLFDLSIPFAMLVGIVGLFESKRRFNMFKDRPFEMMYFDKRISFFKDFKDQKPAANPPFSSAYVCQGVLPRSHVFEKIDKRDV